MTETLSGVALLQRGAENLVTVAGGTTGTAPDTDNTLGTRFQIASVSKQFTAAAMLLLSDRGVLSADDPVRRWLDDCPAAWDQVTLHHLLSHTAGLVHWPGLPGLVMTSPVAAGELQRMLAAVPLLSEPGERFSYSSLGYVLLGHIIEQAAGEAYGAFVSREIFEPLGMTSTFSGNPGDQPRLAAGRHDGTAVPSFELDTACLGTGSIWSTAGDLARWDRALADGELLSAAARRAMFTVQVPAEDDTASLIQTEGYGYGWFIGSASGRRFYYHCGDNPGYRCFNGWFPDDDVRLAMLSNDDTTRFDPTVDAFIQTAFPTSEGPNGS